MIELLLTCSLLSDVHFTLNSINDIPLVVEQCQIVEEVQEWIPLVVPHFKDETALALTVIYCESSGFSKATGVNKDGSYDQGLFQFNERTERWLEKDIYKRDLDMYDPETNVKAARWLSFYDGWHHWNSSKHCWGRYESY
tara:strand:+ start:484 stop:903 length:420 start_codon:yes stop_codon:yes gene_type:complete